MKLYFVWVEHENSNSGYITWVVLAENQLAAIVKLILTDEQAAKHLTDEFGTRQMFVDDKYVERIEL